MTASDLLDQIKLDTHVLSEPFHCHIPSTEFYLERIAAYTKTYRELRDREMGLSLTTTTTTTVKLAPKLKQKLLVKFKEYQTEKAKLDAADARMTELKAEIADLREDTGETSLELEGFKTTVISPTRSKFNEKKFIADGGDISIYKGAVEVVPSKSYEKVTCPSDKGDA